MKRSLLSGLWLCFFIYGTVLPGLAQADRDSGRDPLRELQEDGWKTVQDGVLQRELRTNKVETFVFGEAGFSWKVRDLRAQLQVLRRKFQAHPTPELRRAIASHRKLIASTLKMIERARAAEAGGATFDFKSGCTPTFTRNADASYKTDRQGTWAAASADFNVSSGCGSSGEVYAYAFAETTVDGALSNETVADGPRSGSNVNAIADANSNGGSPCQSYAFASVTSDSLIPTSISTSQTNNQCPVPSSISPWQSADVGTVGTAGSATLSGGTFSVQAGGTALWDASDAFHYVYQPLTGNGEIVARVASLTVPAGANSTLGGVMIREQLTADSIHASMIITAGGKAKFRRRVTAGGMTLSDGPSTSTTYPPRWLKLSRAGNDFTASISDDGVNWTQVHTTQTVPMTGTVYIGLMALRDGPGAPACTATFDNVSVRQLPRRWQSADVGPVGTAGRASHAGGIFTIEAGGTVLYDASDAFHYVYQSLNGDGEITVNLIGLTVPAGAESSMAAVMIREKLTEGSVHASMMITTAGKAKFRRRVTEGGTTLSDGPDIGTLYPPRWLRLTRSGDTFTAYMSSDGSSWTQVHTPVTVAMPVNVHIGFMALRTGGTGTTTATFRDVFVVP